MAIKKRKALKKGTKKTAKRKAAKKIIKKRPLKRNIPKKKKASPAAKAGKNKGNVIGIVTHYFPQVRAAVIKLKMPLAAGDVIKIKGHTTDFTQTVSSMEVDHISINNAKKGEEIGLLVNSRVRQHDVVYKA